MSDGDLRLPPDHGEGTDFAFLKGVFAVLIAMSILAVVALILCSCSSVASTGSVYRDKCHHVGVRPASDGIGDYAMTVQWSTDWNECPHERLP